MIPDSEYSTKTVVLIVILIIYMIVLNAIVTPVVVTDIWNKRIARVVHNIQQSRLR